MNPSNGNCTQESAFSDETTRIYSISMLLGSSLLPDILIQYLHIYSLLQLVDNSALVTRLVLTKLVRAVGYSPHFDNRISNATVNILQLRMLSTSSDFSLVLGRLNRQCPYVFIFPDTCQSCFDRVSCPWGQRCMQPGRSGLAFLFTSDDNSLRTNSEHLGYLPSVMLMIRTNRSKINYTRAHSNG